MKAKRKKPLTLSRVGFDHAGVFKRRLCGLGSAGKEVDTVHRISAEQFAKEVNIGVDKIIDIRKKPSMLANMWQRPITGPLLILMNGRIDHHRSFFLHCAGGYCSMIAASVLQARGYRNFTEIEGGFDTIGKTGLPKTDLFVSKLMKGQ